MKESMQGQSFPVRLRTARQMRELSQGILAAKASLQPSAISHFESGTRKPSFENLRRLADALQVSTDYLLGRTNDISGAVSPDLLHGHYARMSQEDRDLAEKIFDILKNRSRNRRNK